MGQEIRSRVVCRLVAAGTRKDLVDGNCTGLLASRGLDWRLATLAFAHTLASRPSLGIVDLRSHAGAGFLRRLCIQADAAQLIRQILRVRSHDRKVLVVVDEVGVDDKHAACAQVDVSPVRQ